MTKGLPRILQKGLQIGLVLGSVVIVGVLGQIGAVANAQIHGRCTRCFGVKLLELLVKVLFRSLYSVTDHNNARRVGGGLYNVGKHSGKILFGSLACTYVNVRNDDVFGKLLAGFGQGVIDVSLGRIHGGRDADRRSAFTVLLAVGIQQHAFGLCGEGKRLGGVYAHGRGDDVARHQGLHAGNAHTVFVTPIQGKRGGVALFGHVKGQRARGIPHAGVNE